MQLFSDFKVKNFFKSHIRCYIFLKKRKILKRSFETKGKPSNNNFCTNTHSLTLTVAYTYNDVIPLQVRWHIFRNNRQEDGHGTLPLQGGVLLQEGLQPAQLPLRGGLARIWRHGGADLRVEWAKGRRKRLKLITLLTTCYWNLNSVFMRWKQLVPV